MKQTKQQMRNQKVLERLIAFSNEDKGNAGFISENLTCILDDMASEDFFGTERQCDPRGDCRDTHWHMGRVEGVDK